MSIPSYLTSGASSRAHHALIVALHGAKSAQEEDAIAQREIRRIKDVLSNRPSTRKIADSLIILLNCLSVITESVDVGWALVSALQLAEGGKTMRERRMGYLYLCERLSQGHELGLMLINTIRKDLTSTSPQEILLALNTIIHLPSAELRPAVLPLLTSPTLLRHSLPAVRQKTVAAIQSLYRRGQQDLSRTAGPSSFPLSLRKVVSLLQKEQDLAVVATLLEVLRLLIAEKIHVIKEKQERLFLAQLVIAQAKRSTTGWKIHSLVTRMLKELVDDDEACLDAVVVWAAPILKDKKSRPTLLPDMCALISDSSPLEEALSGLILRRISHLLVPDKHEPAAKPNDHVLALSCLASLRPGCWDSLLGQREMQSIMEGIHSCDDTMRLSTLRLLNRLSPELLAVALGHLVESIKSSSDLALPLGLPLDLSADRKLKIGLNETAKRAFEVARIRTDGKAEEARGQGLAGNFVAICEALSAVEDEKSVWEDGVRGVMAILADYPPSSRNGFLSGILNSRPMTDHTLAVVRAMATTEYGNFGPSDGVNAVESVLLEIQEYPASIQELMVVAAVGITSKLEGGTSGLAKLHIDKALDKVKNAASGYMIERCQQIESVVASDELLRRVAKDSRSRSLPDILETIIRISKPAPSSPSTPRSPSSSARKMNQSELRYDAYAAPPAASSSTRSRLKTSRTNSNRRVLSPPEQVAGEYTLFSADEVEYEEPSSLLGEFIRRLC